MKGVIHQQFSVVWSRILASVRRYYDRQKKIPQTSDTWWGDCRRREVFRLRRKTSLLRIPVVQSALLSRARVVDGEGDLMNPQGREASACSPANWYGVRGPLEAVGWTKSRPIHAPQWRPWNHTSEVLEAHPPGHLRNYITASESPCGTLLIIS